VLHACLNCILLATHRRERNIPEIQSMYEVSFLKLSERYYKNASWPAVELIADVVDQDHVFCLLYKVGAAGRSAAAAAQIHSRPACMHVCAWSIGGPIRQEGKG
jgi:hypothetical protein